MTQLKEQPTDNRYIANCYYDVDQLVGIPATMVEVTRLIGVCSESGCRAILVSGEPGTGKELVARAIHMRSHRYDAPFIDVNCAASYDNLGKELFGYERGASDDLSYPDKGVFDYADQGTVFFDEICNIPLSTQRKLLKVIESRSFHRLGGHVNQKANVLVIAATNRNLKNLVDNGMFRGDLYYRLNVMSIFLPPLRERRECIPGLVDYFIGHINTEYHQKVQGVELATMVCLQQYDWPGNIQELRNALEHAIILDPSPLVSPDHLPLEVRQGGANIRSHGETTQTVLEDDANEYSGIILPPEGITLERVEKKLIEQALTRFAGNQTKAAHCLGMSRDTIRYRMKKFAIGKE